MNDPGSAFLRYPALVAALTLAVATVGATIFSLSPLLVGIAQAFDVSVGRAGTLTGAFSIAIAVVAPVVGLGAQRVSRHRLLVAGLAAFAGAWLCALTVERFDALLALTALAGGATGVVLPAAYAYAGDLSDYARRARVMGRVVSGWSLAILVVVPLMAFAAQWIDWRWAFGGLGAAAAAVALWLLMVPRPAGAAAARATGATGVTGATGATGAAPSILGSLRRVAGHRGTRLVLAANLLDMGAFYAVFAYVGAELHRLAGFGPAASGLTVAAYGVGLALVTFNGRHIDRVGKRRTAVAALLALGVVLSALPWLSRAPLAMAAGILVWGCVQGAFFTSITALATEQLPELRGVVTAMLSASTYVGVALYSVLAGALYQGHGYWAVGLASAAGCLAAAALLSRLPRANG
jgi:predicted MFS family arabinose efflux permease